MQTCGTKAAIFESGKWRWYDSIAAATQAEAQHLTERIKQKIAAGERVILPAPRKEKRR